MLIKVGGTHDEPHPAMREQFGTVPDGGFREQGRVFFRVNLGGGSNEDSA
jgi:hypothetical protein